jgi:hypothetical protein
MKKATKQQLEDFAEFCHTRYLGCEKNPDIESPDEWMYEYSNEVVCMIEDYLKLK